MPEKLLTIDEVARILKMPEEEVKRLVDAGEIPAYSIGGSFMRFRKEQIYAVRAEISEIEEKEPEHLKPVLDNKGRPAHTYTKLENDIKRREPVTRQYDYTASEKLKDFFYFNDFYIFAAGLTALLVYLIFRI